MQPQAGRETEKTALLVTCATVLQAAESFLPRLPVPGIKLGLANIFTMIAMVELGFKGAMEVAVLRCLLASLMLGTLMSPGFILSLGASITSTLVMAAFYFPLKTMKKPPISLAGISIAGGVAHNAAQVAIVYFILIRNDAVLWIMPLLAITGALSGFLNGVIASDACAAIAARGGAGTTGFKTGHHVRVPGRLAARAVFMILFAAVFSAAVLLAGRFVFLAVSAAFIAGIAAASGKLEKVVISVWRAKYLALFSVFIPAVFNGGGNPVFQAGPVTITDFGMAEGGFFASRVLILTGISSMLAALLPREAMAEGLRRLLKPLKFIGAGRISEITAMAWINLPEFFERSSNLAKEAARGVRKKKSGIINAASWVVTGLYSGTKNK